MKLKHLKLTGTLAALSLLAACAQQGPYGGGYGGGPNFNKQTAGGVLGAVGGAVAGAQFGQGSGQLAATAAGTLLGAFIGSQIGQSLDRADVGYAGDTTNYALRTNNTSTWQNPQSGNAGTVTPTRTFQTDSGSLCREFQQTITVGGRTERAYGTACRQRDGSWRIVE
jgi:surface antigen